MVFVFLNGYTLNGYISTYTLSLILPLDPYSQKYPQGKANEQIHQNSLLYSYTKH